MTKALNEIITIIETGAKSAMTTEEIIMQEIKEWQQSESLRLMLEGQRYYNGKSDILERKRMVVGEGGRLEEAKNIANNKLIHNFIRKLTDQKVGYLLSKPMNIQTDQEQYTNLLNEFLNKDFLRMLQNIGKEAINKGKAWLHVYYDEQGQFKTKRIPSEEIIPLWKDNVHTDLQGVIRVYDVETYIGKEKTIVTKVEYWDDSGVSRYVLHEDQLVVDVEAVEHHSHILFDDGRGNQVPFNWSRVPFICFKYNEEELPLLHFLKTLIDDYDKHKSDNSNNLEELPNGGIYVLKDYEGTDLGEFRHNLAVYRAVKVMGEGGIDTLSLEIDTVAYKNHMDMNRKDIYEFGRGVDTQNDHLGGDKSGVALKFLYADLDMDCNMIEAEFQAALEQLIWFVDIHLANQLGVDYSSETVDFIFNRDILINETDVINNVKNSVGIISDETLLANHPFVTNVQDELSRLKKQRDEDMESFNTDSYNQLEPPAYEDDHENT